MNLTGDASEGFHDELHFGTTAKNMERYTPFRERTEARNGKHERQDPQTLCF
jgi:hypothetical protein